MNPTALPDTGRPTTVGRQVHLVAECLLDEERMACADDPASWAVPCRPIEVPPGVSYLVDGEAGGSPHLVRDAPEDGRPAHLLEPLTDSRRGAVLLVSPAGRPARINGVVAPPVALLAEGDQVTIGDGVVLHVLWYRQPQVGTPPPEVVGKKCPVCLTPIRADQTIYRCSACDTAMHLEGDEGLDCARLASECRTCERPVTLDEGYGFVPEGIRIESA